MERKRDAQSRSLPFWGSCRLHCGSQDSTQVIPFKHALNCIRALIDENMMSKYRSHTEERIAYIENYLGQIQGMKDLFLEFQVSKCTQASTNSLW